MTTKSRYVHSSGEDEEGVCLACCLDWTPDQDLRAHDADPDPSSDSDDPWCGVCGHEVDEVAVP